MDICSAPTEAGSGDQEAGYMLRIDCWEAEKNLKTTPGSDCALTSLEKVDGSNIQIPVHSRVAIVGNLKEYHEVGDHYLYICDVEQVYGNPNEEALFAWNGYSKLGPAKQV